MNKKKVKDYSDLIFYIGTSTSLLLTGLTLLIFGIIIILIDAQSKLLPAILLIVLGALTIAVSIGIFIGGLKLHAIDKERAQRELEFNELKTNLRNKNDSDADIIHYA